MLMKDMGFPSSSSNWSNLPLDLLFSVKEKLDLFERSDLASFRSVCSHWCSTMPTPTPFPCYEVNFNKKKKTIEFIMNNNTSGIGVGRSIHLSLPSSSPMSFFCSSNGWLVFIASKNIISIHLFDPVSNYKCIFPPLSPPNLLCRQKKLQSNFFNASQLILSKVIVSSKANESIAVAAIVQITNLNKVDRRMVFCRLDEDAKWNLFMEESKEIVDIALADDGRFYAIGENLKLYMLDERPQFIRLKKFKLLLPKHIMELDPECDSIDERLLIKCCGMEKGDGSKLIIYGYCEKFRFKGSWISLKLETTKLCGRNNNVDVACEAERHHLDPSSYYVDQYFMPSLGKI